MFGLVSASFPGTATLCPLAPLAFNTLTSIFSSCAPRRRWTRCSNKSKSLRSGPTVGPFFVLNAFQLGGHLGPRIVELLQTDVG
jgi:hypothetical protein